MRRWEGPFHDAEHERITRVLEQNARSLQALRLSPSERAALQTAAAKLVADEAIGAAKRRRRPIWEDRRALASLTLQLTVALVVVLTLLHTLNPALP